MKRICLLLFLSLAWSSCAEDHSGHGGGGTTKDGKAVLVTYRVVGDVRKTDPEKIIATIKHEDIKGYMDGMTMDYTVRDRELLASFAAGDRIEFWLETGGERPVIVEVKKLQ